MKKGKEEVEMSRKILNKIVLLSVILVFAGFVYAMAPNVTLMSPADSQNFTTANNVTFNCSTASDSYIWNVSLYHNVTGSFELTQTKFYGESGNDSSTLLLCHFNDNYTCVDGEAGTNTSTSFDSGKFKEGVLVNNTDTLTYSAVNNFDRDQGTIEVWVKPYFNVSDLDDDVVLLTVGEDDANLFTLYVHSWDDQIEFYIYDSGGGDHYVAKNISSWQAGEWHHLAGIWDLDSGVSGSHRLELYVDGSNSGNQYYLTTSNVGLDSDPSNVFVGTWWGSSWWGQANSTIDELRISNVVRTASEINESYQRGIANYTNVSANWTMNVSDGNYIWNCLAFDNESQSNWSASNYSFTVDVNPPVFNSVTISPNSTDDTDPGVTINVTANVTDVLGVDTVILQWTETGVWNNVTMNGSNGNYNASFDIGQTGGTYYYRIWTNDTFGHANTSSTYNVSAEWDPSWTRSPADFGIVNGSINSNGSIGILTINNTGDYTLGFDLSDDWPWEVSYNVTEPFNLNNKTSIDINITIKFAGEDEVRGITINITASHGTQTPSPTSATTAVTVETYSGGPYLITTITSYPLSVYQSQTFNLSASVKNIGNETANGTWLNWTLPTGWENVSGELNRYIGDVNSGETELNVITATVDANSGTTGIMTINASASCISCAENSSDSSDSKLVAVSCSDTDGICGLGCSSSTDTDCPAPAAPSRGGGSPTPRLIELPLPTTYSPTPAQRKDILDVEETFEVVRGKNSSFEVSVTNPFEDSTIEDLGLKVGGTLAQYLKVKDRGKTDVQKIKIEFASEPSEEGLRYNETRTYEIAVAAPTYIDKGTYPLNLTITGNVFYTDYPASVSEKTGEVLEYKNITFEMVETKIINLAVHVISRDEGDAAVEGGITDMGYMQNAGFSTKRINRLLEAARIAMVRGDYGAARKIREEIAKIKEAAFSARDAIYRLQNMIRDAEEVRGLKIPETKELLSLALAAFEREDYETALQRANDANLVYSSETRGEVNYAKMLLDNLAAVIVGAGAFIVVGIVSFNKASAAITARRLGALDVSEINIMGLMRDTQENYYIKKTVSPTVYKETMDEFTKRLTEIKSERAKLKAKRAAMIRPSEELKSLKEENQNLEELIRDAQDRYYNRKAMSKREYDESMGHYMDRQVEVEEAIAVLETKVLK